MVNKEIAAALADEARRAGKPLFYLANDLVGLYLRAREKGFDLGDVLITYESMMILKKTGHVMIPNSTYQTLTEGSVSAERLKETGTIWRENGHRLGKYVESLSDDPIRTLGNLLPFMFWDINFELKRNNGENILCLPCPNQSEERARLILNLVEGYMEACGYSIHSSEAITGLVQIKFSELSQVYSKKL
ncbi:MAG: hypothetical protein M1503_10460 [Thaumarchaeota archaeon]|nr:hypothetical protein [Nitrososphaerota archaeon]MCL5318662.1 hypothetical protein [Nitrososphaerota archaeon]